MQNRASRRTHRRPPCVPGASAQAGFQRSEGTVSAKRPASSVYLLARKRKDQAFRVAAARMVGWLYPIVSGESVHLVSVRKQVDGLTFAGISQGALGYRVLEAAALAEQAVRKRERTFRTAHTGNPRPEADLPLVVRAQNQESIYLSAGRIAERRGAFEDRAQHRGSTGRAAGWRSARSYEEANMTSNSQHSNALKLIVLGTPNLPKGSALRPRATLPEEAARQKVSPSPQSLWTSPDGVQAMG